jgi:hypothetical protein
MLLLLSMPSFKTMKSYSRGNWCLSMQCRRRFCGVLHSRSQSGSRQAYYGLLAERFVWEFTDVPIPAKDGMEGRSYSFGERSTGGRMQGNMTYRSLSFVSLSGIDRIVVLCNMQVQEMLVWKVLLAFAAPVHMRLLVVHIMFFNRSEGERLMWGQ